MANITASILMRWTASTTTYAVDILITLAAMFRKIDAGAEHTADICMTFIKTFLHDSVDERTTMKEHSLVCLWDCRARRISGSCTGRSGSGSADFLSYFLSSMGVTFPQLAILNFLYLYDILRQTN